MRKWVEEVIGDEEEDLGFTNHFVNLNEVPHCPEAWKTKCNMCPSSFHWGYVPSKSVISISICRILHSVKVC